MEFISQTSFSYLQPLCGSGKLLVLAWGLELCKWLVLNGLLHASKHKGKVVDPIAYNASACQNVSQALEKEWCQKNKLGAFASSTIPSVNTRRSHGLFVARLKDPLGQYVLLSNLDETLYIDDVAYPLSTRIQSGKVYPEGYRFLHQFSLSPFPTWTFHVDDLVIEKNIVVLSDEQTALVRYQILWGDEDLVRLEVKPMTAFRHIDELAYHNQNLNTKIDRLAGRIRFAGLYFHHNAAILDQAGTWYRSIHYPEEQKLGLDFEEDLYAPFGLVYAFGNNRENFLCASIEDREEVNFTKLVTQELKRSTPSDKSP